MRQSPLFAPPPDARPFRRRYLYGLDITSPRYPRDAAARISALDRRLEVEAAIDEIARPFAQMVETLVVAGIARRVACAPHEKIRELLLAEVPAYLLTRVIPLAKSYEVTRPWEPRRRAEA